MRITVLASGSYRSPLTFRGLVLGRRLGAKGHEVTLIAPKADKYNDFRAEEDPRDPHLRIVQPWQFRTRMVVLNLLPYLVSSCLALLRSRPDAVYLYKPTPITMSGVLLRWLRGIPYVVDLDDLGAAVMEGEGQSPWRTVLVDWCERTALRHAAAVVVTSRFLEERVRTNAPGTPVTVVPNGVDADEYVIGRGGVRPFVYYFGAINRLSLLEPFLRALPAVRAACPEAEIAVLGGGTDLEAAQALVDRLGVGDVSFSGWIDMMSIQEHTRLGDVAVCVQPAVDTVRAASNMKVFQYMAMGSVAVVSDVGDLPLYVDEGRAGVVTSPEPDAVAETIVGLLRDPERRERLGRAGRQRAETVYSWDALADDVDRVLASVASAGRRQIRR